MAKIGAGIVIYLITIITELFEWIAFALVAP